MADPKTDSPVMLTTKSQILVTVDEALQDILVVSYAVESKLFQGVLLDSTKRFLPCRLPDPPPPPTGPKAQGEEDKLFFSIRQRFTYFQEKPIPLNHFHLKKVSSKGKGQKMTVRLRPRQVLCSKCKSICNENSENMGARGRKGGEGPGPDKSPRPLFSENRRENSLGATASPPKPLCPTLIPRLPRLQPSEITSALNGTTQPRKNGEGGGSPFWLKGDDDEDSDKQMVLRKKRSVGSMEDLWDETVFEEGAKKAKTTPVIKISFGSQGEGTVLKIPSKVQTCSESETDDSNKATSAAKAAKKALKKAKKEARKKNLPPSSPPDPSSSPPQYKKHRHKVKHKKKHKSGKGDDEMKERCLKHKLSINLKRVSSTSYEKAADDSDSGESSQSSEDIPDFPPTSPAPSMPDVESCPTTDGNTLAVGDIVWGKMQGFPWWPAKVLNIAIRTGGNAWDAQVSWFGSSTSSLMPCDQLSPFLQTFKVRYNRRKKSAGYQEAIRQATSAASASNPDIKLPSLVGEALASS